MKCPKAVIDLFARNLRIMVMDIEQYIDEGCLPLNPTQLERLQRMNQSMKAQYRRLKQAWREHDPNVDTTDADIIEELDGIVYNIKTEVSKTLEISRAVLQKHGIEVKKKWKTTIKQQEIEGIYDEEPTMETPQIRHSAGNTTPEENWVTTNVTGIYGVNAEEKQPSEKSQMFMDGQSRHGCGNSTRDKGRNGNPKTNTDEHQHRGNGSGNPQKHENGDSNYGSGNPQKHKNCDRKYGSGNPQKHKNGDSNSRWYKDGSGNPKNTNSSPKKTMVWEPATYGRQPKNETPTRTTVKKNIMTS